MIDHRFTIRLATGLTQYHGVNTVYTQKKFVPGGEVGGVLIGPLAATPSSSMMTDPWLCVCVCVCVCARAYVHIVHYESLCVPGIPSTWSVVRQQNSDMKSAAVRQPPEAYPGMVDTTSYCGLVSRIVVLYVRWSQQCNITISICL